MRKIIYATMLLMSFHGFSQQKNTLLERNFWSATTSIEAVKEEIEKGNSPSQLNEAAFDPVTLAIMNNAPLETILFLLEQSGNGVDKPTHDARTYLHWAAFKGNVALVNQLISKGFNLYNKDTRGMMPIVFAANSGVTNPEVYEAFFKAGMNPKMLSDKGETLIHLTIANDDITMPLTNFFLNKGLSLKDKDKNGATTFDYACTKGNIDLLKKLKKLGVKHTENALLFAAQGTRRSSNKMEVYQYLVNELKIKPNANNKNGQNVLHFLVTKEKQDEILNFFLEKKVNVNQIDNQGNTPFILAGGNKENTPLKVLFPYVKNHNQTNKKGESALSKAVEYGSAESVEFLLKNNADYRQADSKGNYLGHYLIEGFRPQNSANFEKKIAILKAQNLDFQQKQTENNTLYHLAVNKNNIELVQKIATLGIDVNAKNDAGETALHRAAMLGKNMEIFDFLIKQGADANLKTEFGETAYDLVKENELLKEKLKN